MQIGDDVVLKVLSVLKGELSGRGERIFINLCAISPGILSP
jgi:hypothetical protein